MDFARRQLEKYGWVDGKGLGKNENGISEALKPKLKRSVTGIGHDAAAEFNEHWWSALYDKAAKNVEVKEKNGKTKKIKTIDDFTITNSTWKINKKFKNNEDGNEYSEYFIKKATLSNDGIKIENVDSASEIEEEKKDVFKMTDEELFKACEGRTAHKGARHGFKALGKLARIAQQEQMLLTQTKYQGYSHAKKVSKSGEDIVENTSIADNEEEKLKRKKKKKKRCLSNEIDSNCDQAEYNDVPLPNVSLKSNNGDTSNVKKVGSGRKTKELEEQSFEVQIDTCGQEIVNKSKKRRTIEETEIEVTVTESVEAFEESITDVPKKKKKKKHRKSDKV